MALQTSGAISIGDIATEFGGSAPHSLSEYYGAAAGVPTSGQIGIANFYGKSSQFTFTITSNQTNANLATLATAAGWDGSSNLQATINSGVYISSNSTGTPALTVSGSFPTGVTLINNGYIVGRGGNGGYGGGYNPNAYNGTAGASGGLALNVSSTITIDNTNGTIAGGGGGGGGGGTIQANEGSGEDSFSYATGGGGGGGGRSSAAANSSGGAGGNVIVTGASGGAGGAGTVSSAGSGGSRAYYDSRNYGGNGGAGGNWGASGSSGGNAYFVGVSYTRGKAGGAAGSAVSGNSNVTWSATGTRLGGIS